MRTNKCIAMVAVAATTLFVACQKEGGDNPATGDGAETRFGLTFTFPSHNITRAADGNANVSDVAIGAADAICVFIFKADGSAADGNGTVLDLSDFTQHATIANQWTLGAPISSTTGTKIVYIGINLPTSMHSIASETTLKNAFTTTGLMPGALIPMLGTGTVNLAPSTGADVPDQNKITVTAERLMTKVTTTFASATSSWTLGTGDTYTVAPDQFSVGGTATDFFPKQKTNGLTGDDKRLYVPGDVNNTKTSTLRPTGGPDATLTAINATGTASNDANIRAKFVPEHATSNQLLRREATYAVVRGLFTFTHYSKMNAGRTAIETEAAPTSFTNGDKVYVISYDGKTYFCSDTAETALVLIHLGLPNNAYSTYTYDGGFYTFYYVFLNRDKTDMLAVYRNQYINISVRNVLGMGQPGTTPDPELPDTPNRPDQPAVEVPANLVANVDVAPWDYYSVPTDLQ